MVGLPDKVKSVIPRRCELCGVGVGTSLFKVGSVWKEHKHLFEHIFAAQIGIRSLQVDEWCYENLAKKHHLREYEKKYT